jgi:predicted SAM-dependent methyltransferase
MSQPIFDSRKVLEIGGGEKPLFHPNMDIRKVPGVDIVVDLNKEWPIPAESYGGIYSSYVIEHISWRKIPHFVSEAYRVLEFGGRAVFITANLKAQAERLASKDDFADQDLSMIFGDQDYEGDDWRANSHTCGFSPESAQRIFQAAGFLDVLTYVHPGCPTDMVIEAMKMIPRKSDGSVPIGAYDKKYFHGGNGSYGGYAEEGYRDFVTNWNVYNAVMEKKPGSVLELGCSRGYLLKRFQDLKIPVIGLDASRHCYMTRAIDGIVEWDITQIPWPIKDRSMDVCLSVSTLEHITESKIDVVISEIKRTCARSFHVVNFGDKDDGFDRTHVLFRSREWWKERFGDGDHKIHSEQEYTRAIDARDVPTGDGEVKLNLGCYVMMFHYGWTNVDILDLSEFAKDNIYRFIRSDLTAGFPGAPSDTVELIYMSHLIEHLGAKEGLFLLGECRRVLKPGGLIRVSCPDAKKITQMYAENRLSEFEEINDGCGKFVPNVQKLHNLLYENHKVVYDEELLAKVLKEAGFVRIQKKAFRESSSEKMLRETLDMHPFISLYMEASRD